jgi:F-type H+-transporting ATPase subunit epsilon
VAAPQTLPTFLGVNLVTPKGVVAHTDTDALAVPGELGALEILPGHVAMLTALKPGVLVIGEKSPARYAVGAGYLRVDPTNAIEVLVEKAIPAKEIDLDAARADLKAGEAEVAKWGDKPLDGDFQALRLRVQWAQARIDAVSAH